MNSPTKTDQRAAERLLKRAVQGAIADLHAEHTSPAPDFEFVYDHNVERFTTALAGAEIFLADTTQKETTAC